MASRDKKPLKSKREKLKNSKKPSKKTAPKFTKSHPSLSLILVVIISILIVVSVTLYFKNNTVNRTQFSNHLVNSSSPYLLQHSQNPVDWYPWGNEAFEKARRENKPILISIGYSTCYWCHVMEREVFENKIVAKLMNRSVVSIKVDKEERPDVDVIYMTARKLITRTEGWPNNVFTTPDLKPFFATTYLPASSFKKLIKRIKDEWKSNNDEIQQQAKDLTKNIIGVTTKQNNITGDLLLHYNIEKLFKEFANYYDNNFGGFYQAPKFPNENILLFLLSLYELENNEIALDMLRNTLQKMSQGGINDVLGGGFHRYSTDDKWRIPHFEKMLYNQALLGRVYARNYRISKSNFDKNITQNIHNYVIRQMTHKDGGFYSALDSHTDGVEGDYYAWKEDEIESLLSEKQLSWFKEHYALEDIPNIWGHKNTDSKILYLQEPFKEEQIQRNNEILELLLNERLKRKLPNLDDKIITSWNGLMINSFALAGNLLDQKEYVDVAQEAADFILNNLQKDDGSLYRSWRNGVVGVNGFFEDYAFMIQGLVSLHKVTNEAKYLKAAVSLIGKSQELFKDNENGGYFFTDGQEDLLVRTKNGEDSSVPSANAVMVHALLDLYLITNEDRWKLEAKEILESFTISMQQNPTSHTHMIHALLRYNYIGSN